MFLASIINLELCLVFIFTFGSFLWTDIVISSDVAANEAPHSANLLSSNSITNTSSLFGSSLAITNTEIYVGDPGQNTVFIFRYSSSGRLSTSGEINAPEGVNGFGYALDHGGDGLLIGAYSRVKTEGGAVFHYNPLQGLIELARSDDTHILGFAVAAHTTTRAYSRRLRNDPEHQSGDVVVLVGNAARTISLPAYPDYFGASISIAGNGLFALAPAFGASGGAFMFDPNSSSNQGVPFAVPAGFGRANAESPIAVTPKGCIISGAGSKSRNSSLLWRDCQPEKPELIAATGAISARSGRIAFAGQAAKPRFGVIGPFSVYIQTISQNGAALMQLASPSIASSLQRNVALSEDKLITTLTLAEGGSKIEIHTLTK